MSLLRDVTSRQNYELFATSLFCMEGNQTHGDNPKKEILSLKMT
jgi:hypothetical protein